MTIFGWLIQESFTPIFLSRNAALSCDPVVFLSEYGKAAFGILMTIWSDGLAPHFSQCAGDKALLSFCLLLQSRPPWASRLLRDLVDGSTEGASLEVIVFFTRVAVE